MTTNGLDANQETKSSPDIAIKFQRPRIFCADLKDSDFSILKSEGYNLFKGNLGKILTLKHLSAYSNTDVNLNHEFPENFHEYDILILDLTNENKGEYVKTASAIGDRKNRAHSMLRYSHPVNLFDPRPICSSFLPDMIKKIKGRKFIRIVFACASYHVNYRIVNVDTEGHESISAHRAGIYDFLEDRLQNSVTGHDARLVDEDSKISSIIKKFTDGLTYHQTFFHPLTGSVIQGQAKSERFIPLMVNVNGEIISYVELDKQSPIFVFPNIKRKGQFLSDFLSDLMPEFAPDLFPYSTQFLWKSMPEYFLPKHQELLNDRNSLEVEYKSKVETVEKKILENQKKYAFLHDILTASGDELVSALVKYLRWLEFLDVRAMDEHATSVLEEDIQIVLDNGLLIIESKGIGGTSTDSDCSQVSKIRYRRQRERNAMDVTALYIVNHQRHLPPLARRNPPFTEHQISDAINDDRGLVSTWQLFNLYHDINKGLLSKEDARKQFLQHGLLQFLPPVGEKLPEIKELLKGGKVAILDLPGGYTLKVGQILFKEQNNAFDRIEIISLQMNDDPVFEVHIGEVGIQLNEKITKSTRLWTSQV